MTTREKTRLDPVTLEVIRNALPAIANEMSVDLQRTSYNAMIYEVRDYCCALLDVEGRLLSQNIGGVSHFVADLGVVIKDGVARYGRDGFEPGDVIVTNHQRVAGQHLCNICVYTPLFFEGELLGFAVVRAHWVDVGGMSTGLSFAAAVSDPWMEGLQLDQIKLYERGVPDQKVLKIIRDNIRLPDSSLGDLRAQLAACRLAERRFEELLRRYGQDVVMASVERIFDETEAKCRAAVEKIPDGEYTAESLIDHDLVERDRPVLIRVRVVVKGGDMTIDLTGCEQQRRGAINSRTLAGACVAYKAITTPLEHVNEGSFRALKVEIQEGNIMMAQFPAPMAGWSMVLPAVIDTVIKALAPALPDRIPAAHQGSMGGVLVVVGRNPRTGRNFISTATAGAGWGGRPWEDGESASVTVCQGDVRNSPIENTELKSPVLMLTRRLRQDSGGPGKHRGGLGVEMTMKCLVEGYWNLQTSMRTKCPPWGLWGGKPGATAISRLRLSDEDELKQFEVVRYWAPAGATGVSLSSGGGGWGDPLERDSERVKMDVLEEYVSRQAARDEYGVVLDPETLAVDQAGTEALRDEMRMTRS